jgi:hypothetical protein
MSDDFRRPIGMDRQLDVAEALFHVGHLPSGTDLEGSGSPSSVPRACSARPSPGATSGSTPELVHGVTLRHPGLALVLLKVGYFAGWESRRVHVWEKLIGRAVNYESTGRSPNKDTIIYIYIFQMPPMASIVPSLIVRPSR